MVQLSSTRRRPSSPWRRCEALPSSPSRDVQAPKRGGKALVPMKVVVCALVGFLGVLSAALGFAAEGTRVKVIVVKAATGRRGGFGTRPVIESMLQQYGMLMKYNEASSSDYFANGRLQQK